MNVAHTEAPVPDVADLLADGKLPRTYRAAYLDRADAERYATSSVSDVRDTLKVGQVPFPEIAPDEVVVAVMASALNYNTIWSAQFKPVSTFAFLGRLGRSGGWDARHDQAYHVVGSDAAGMVVKVGAMVKNWSVGDRVVVHACEVESENPSSYTELVIGKHHRAWGYETNFGGLADFAIVKSAQLLPKPRHLTWEEAACNTLCATTAYRMLVGSYAARMKQGDIVLVWGATGGLGSYAVQMVRNGGGTAVGVVSSERRAMALEALGCDVIVRRDVEGLAGLTGNAFGKAIGRIVRRELGEDPNIVFEYVGAQTFGASVYLVRPGGSVVTCGSSTGYEHTYDNRYLWMRSKRIIGSHGGGLIEAWDCGRLIEQGRIQPALTDVVPLEDVASAARAMQHNRHIGKIGVICLAPREGLGVEDPQRRTAIGDDKIEVLRGFGSAAEWR